MRKDATLTIRVPRPTRRRLEAHAHREGRSLSQQAERLIERGLDQEAGSGAGATGTLSGLLAAEAAPAYGEFRAVRTVLSASLSRSGRSVD
jgi:hypothetical protein